MYVRTYVCTYVDAGRELARLAKSLPLYVRTGIELVRRAKSFLPMCLLFRTYVRMQIQNLRTYVRTYLCPHVRMLAHLV